MRIETLSPEVLTVLSCPSDDVHPIVPSKRQHDLNGVFPLQNRGGESSPSDLHKLLPVQPQNIAASPTRASRCTPSVHHRPRTQFGHSCSTLQARRHITSDDKPRSCPTQLSCRFVGHGRPGSPGSCHSLDTPQAAACRQAPGLAPSPAAPAAILSAPPRTKVKDSHVITF